MIVRDIIKNEEYYTQYILDQNQRIEKFMKVFSSLKEADDKKATQCQQIICNFQKDKLIAMYSAGYSKNEISLIAEEYISNMLKLEFESYNDVVILLSFMILFDIHKEFDFTKIPYCDDTIVQFLIGYLLDDEMQEETELAYEKEYSGFEQYINDSDLKAFKQFITKEWYRLCKDCSWYDSHLNTNDVYNGYWCWLGAALLKIKGVEQYKCMFEYIPYDLI